MDKDCEDCKHEDTLAWVYPCDECINENHLPHYEPKGEDR